MLHVYTGNGKGKTTAALGLCLRAAGAGKTVFFCQFLKGRGSSELGLLKKIKGVHVERFGRRQFITGKPSGTDIAAAEKGLKRVKKALSVGQFDVFILDEINSAFDLGLLGAEELLPALKDLPGGIEVILTGRNAPRCLMKQADLVSEVREIKHYFRKGVKARKGIEY